MPLTRPLYALAGSIMLFGMASTSLAQTEPRGFYATVYAQASNLGSTTFDELGNAGFGSGLKATFGSGLGLGGDIGFATAMVGHPNWNGTGAGMTSSRSIAVALRSHRVETLLSTSSS